MFEQRGTDAAVSQQGAASHVRDELALSERLLSKIEAAAPRCALLRERLEVMRSEQAVKQSDFAGMEASVEELTTELVLRQRQFVSITMRWEERKGACAE